MTSKFRLALAAPLALVLAACGSGAEETAALEGEAIAAVPAPAGTAWTDVTTVTEQGGFQVGNPDAKLKLVEYASHTCGACAQFAATGVEPLMQDYVSKGTVSFEIRPLLRDPLDVTISVLARCGSPEGFHALSEQGWASLTQFSENLQSAPGAYEAAMQGPIEQRFTTLAQGAGLFDFFAARGISTDQAQACLADTDNISAIAEKSQTQATADGVTGTPTFFLNGTRVDGTSWAALEPVLQSAGAR